MEISINVKCKDKGVKLDTRLYTSACDTKSEICAGKILLDMFQETLRSMNAKVDAYTRRGQWRIVRGWRSLWNKGKKC